MLMRARIRTLFVIGVLVHLSVGVQAVQIEFSNDSSEPRHALVTKAIAMMEGQSPHTPEDFEQLEKDVLIVLRSEPIHPQLLASFGKLYRVSGRSKKAIAMAKAASEYHAEYNLQYAQICKEAGRDHHAEMIQAARAAEVAFNVKLGTKDETDNDRVGLAHSLEILGENKTAIEILEKGLSSNPSEHLAMRNALAELYVQESRSVNAGNLANRKNLAGQQFKSAPDAANGATRNDSEATIDWTFLQKAAKLAPNNTKLGAEIAFQWRHSTEPPTDLIYILQDQLDDGVASIATRLIIAEIHLISGTVSKAKREWETILEKHPDTIPALNNLAVVLSRETPPKIDRALELIEQANRIKLNDPEIADSAGMILMKAGRFVDAISKFEKVLTVQPDRISTRKKLVKCYREIGDELQAEANERQIERFREKSDSK